MSISLSQPDPSPCTAIGEAVHVPAGAGITKWFFGGTDTTKLTSQLTNGSPPWSMRTRTPRCPRAAAAWPRCTVSRPADRSAAMRHAVSGGTRWRCTSQ